MDINYKIDIYTYWHCGSGLSKGADTDALVIKDEDGLPFIPGKTIKGLFREALEDYLSLSGGDMALFLQAFGSIEFRSETYFSNATLSVEEGKWIAQEKLGSYMYKNIARTAIEDGVAKKNSLRSQEVVVPCTLHGFIKNFPDNLVEDMKKSWGLIKSVGVNRNRGLGRCSISIEKGGNL